MAAKSKFLEIVITDDSEFKGRNAKAKLAKQLEAATGGELRVKFDGGNVFVAALSNDLDIFYADDREGDLRTQFAKKLRIAAADCERIALKLEGAK